MAHFRIVHSLAAIFALLSIALCIIGIFNTYTPVPFWDMWPGVVAFETRLMDGHISDLWKQHVSHRIVFSNLLFTIDGALFQGSTKFLLAMHVLLMSLIAFWFYRTMRLEPTFSLRNPLDFAVLMLLIAISFSWIQWRNITWAFQSQMFATNLFPATAFLLLYHSSTQIKAGAQKTGAFVGALVVGFCSAFTMMNGVLALPMMILLAIALRLPFTRVLIIALVACLTLTLFFSGYEKAELETSFLGVLLEHTGDVLWFAFALLGAPVHYFFTEPFLSVPADTDMTLAFASGIPIAAGLLVMTIRLIAMPGTRKIGLLMFAVLFYTAAAIGAIATGRYGIGVTQALESRYMTNVLFTWSMFMLLVWFTFKNTQRFRLGLYGFITAVSAIFLSYQYNTLKQNSWPRWEQNVGVLAVELGVRDQTAIEFVFPWIDQLFEMTSDAQRLDTSIFGHPFYKGVKETLGTAYSGFPDDAPACDLSQEFFRTVPDNASHLAIGGVLFSPSPALYPAQFTILSADGTIIGYAMTERSAYVPLQSPTTHATWMKGFILSHKDETAFSLASDTYNCIYGPVIKVQG